MSAMKWVVAGILATSFLAVGCGGMKPLTAEQKAQVKATMESTGRSVNAPRDLSRPSRDGWSNPVEIGDFSPMTRFAEQLTSTQTSPVRASSTRSRNDQDYVRMRRKLEAARNCKPKLEETPTNVGVPKLHLTLEGSDCPATLDLNLAVNAASNGSAEIQVACRYQVTDAEYRTFNDIDAMDVQGSAKIIMTGNERDMTVKANLDVSGKLHSQKHGDVGIKLFGEAEGRGMVTQNPGATTTASGGARGEMGLRLDYPSFAAELKIKGEGEKLKYLINGEEVSKEEFQAFFESMSNGF